MRLMGSWGAAFKGVQHQQHLENRLPVNETSGVSSFAGLKGLHLLSTPVLRRVASLSLDYTHGPAFPEMDHFSPI